jgi:hypothetical protein
VSELVFSFIGEAGVTYQLHVSPNLEVDSWEPFGPAIEGLGQSQSLRHTMTGQRQFFRMHKLP